MKVVGIIPSRYGSTRLHAKPLVDLEGKTMVQRVYEQAKRAKLLNDVIIATDHATIATAAEKFGGKVAMTSPELQSGSDRIAAVAKNLLDTAIIVNIQGDEPLIEPEMIDQAIAPMLQSASMIVNTVIKKIASAKELHNPAVVKAILNEHGEAIYFSRSPIPYLRGVAPELWHTQHTFYKHFGIYVYRRDFLLKFTTWSEGPLERAEKLEQLRIIEHGFKINATITEYDSIPIDTAEDVEKVISFLRSNQWNGKK
jgi:3-deoxy-manno-octulosonate cytidylyltransferase (CMP-KDO synthetase)